MWYVGWNKQKRFFSFLNHLSYNTQLSRKQKIPNTHDVKKKISIKNFCNYSFLVYSSILNYATFLVASSMTLHLSVQYMWSSWYALCHITLIPRNLLFSSSFHLAPWWISALQKSLSWPSPIKKKKARSISLYLLILPYFASQVGSICHNLKFCLLSILSSRM